MFVAIPVNGGRICHHDDLTKLTRLGECKRFTAEMGPTHSGLESGVHRVSFRHHHTVSLSVSISTSQYQQQQKIRQRRKDQAKHRKYIELSRSSEQKMALPSRYGASFDLVSNITKRKVSAMEIFVRGQYEDTFRDHGNADELIDIARRGALEKTRLSVMREHTVVRPDGTMKPVSAEFYMQYILRRMWFICCRKLFIQLAVVTCLLITYHR